MREIQYPSGTRHKDRAAIEERLATLEPALTERELEAVIETVELALAAGGRKVPGWVGR